MPTITIPKELVKSKNLIAVLPNMYEEFLQWQRAVKSVKTYKPTAREKKELARARKHFAEGKYVTLSELKRELGIEN